MAATRFGGSLRTVVTEGTHRVRHPMETWEELLPLLPRYGITRVADVTRLDVLGIPVVMAVRPLAKTLTVSQGKGQTLPLARVSAVMESIELWHAEYARAPTVCSDTPARALNLPYRIGDLATGKGSMVNELTRLDWVAATTLRSGRATMVPTCVTHLYGPDEDRWYPPGLVEDTTGLASGNVWEEAVLHALYEVIERDAVSRQSLQEPPWVVDLNTIQNQGLAAMVGTIEAGGASLSLVNILNRFDIPCYTAYVWSADFPLISIGYGAHLAQDVAASRAITEAVQTRLTGIVGSRDDLLEMYGRIERGALRPVNPLRPTVGWRDHLGDDPDAPFVDLSGELDHVGAVVERVAGVEPLVVDLSTESTFSVVKVFIPGAAVDPDRLDPKGEQSVYAQAVAWQARDDRQERSRE